MVSRSDFDGFNLGFKVFRFDFKVFKPSHLGLRLGFNVQKLGLELLHLILKVFS
jgi:hypothetical protein